MTKNELPTQAELVRATVAGLTAITDMEDEAGYCWRHTRLRLRVAGVPKDLIPPIGVDAIGAAHWYRVNHPDLCKTNGSVPGDVLFYELHHGPHGHVVTRITANRAAENSVAHAPEGERDGRGTRALSAIGVPTLIVRLWR